MVPTIPNKLKVPQCLLPKITYIKIVGFVYRAFLVTRKRTNSQALGCANIPEIHPEIEVV